MMKFYEAMRMCIEEGKCIARMHWSVNPRLVFMKRGEPSTNDKDLEKIAAPGYEILERNRLCLLQDYVRRPYSGPAVFIESYIPSMEDMLAHDWRVVVPEAQTILKNRKLKEQRVV